MNDKKQLECYLHCCATEKLSLEIEEDKKREDRPIGELLDEQPDKDS